MAARIRIGDMLVQAGMLTAARLQEALAEQKERGRRLGDILVERGYVSEVQLTQTLSNQLSLPWVSLYHVDFSRQLLNLVPRELAEKYCVIPVYVRAVRKSGDTLFAAMDDPTNEEALGAVAAAAGMPVKAMVAPPSEIKNAIRVYYGGGAEVGDTPEGRATVPIAVRRKKGAAEVEVVPASPPAVVVARPASGAPPAPPIQQAPPPASVEPPAPPVEAPPPAAPVAAAALPPTPAPEPEPAPEPAPAGPEPRAEVATRPQKRPKADETFGAKRPKPRMISLTLLDGTTVTLPAPGAKAADEPPAAEDALTAGDLVAALRAVAHGADVSDVLPNRAWEPLFAALLSILLKKHIVADWEFVDEWKKQLK